MDIVVVNSFGPMGSTPVGSLIEKFGFLNLPVRKLGLHDYLVGERSIEDPYMVGRILENLTHHNAPLKQGGINVLDRDSASPRQLVDKSRVEADIQELKQTRFDSVAHMYHSVKSIYAKAVSYKEIDGIPERHIEYTTDLIYHSPEELYQDYKAHFDNVYMIHIHRDFVSWMNSLASQAFAHTKIKHRFKPMLIGRRLGTYTRYKEVVNGIPGLHLNFEELFLPDTLSVVGKIGNYLGMDIPELDWNRETFDLYGKLTSFEKAFTLMDDHINYLSPVTQRYILKATKGKIRSYETLGIGLMYLIDGIRFQFSHRNSR
ncbi:MAG: hypothetical protein MI802_05870 [Desulfobacterales bacterium]|nr:hypothetical protein [Desulfobacterales bacterium]